MIKLTTKSLTKYVPISERECPENEQTVFTLKPLTVSEESEVMDALFHKGAPAPHRQYQAAFRVGVVDIENLIGPDGAKVQFKHDEAIVSMIPRTIRDEVALEVLKSLERTKEETKN